jgi:hypothetical protein
MLIDREPNTICQSQVAKTVPSFILLAHGPRINVLANRREYRVQFTATQHRLS